MSLKSHRLNLTALLGTVCRPAGDARVLEITSKTRAFLISEGSGLVTKRECVHKVFCASVCCALPDQQSMWAAEEHFGDYRCGCKMPGSCMPSSPKAFPRLNSGNSPPLPPPPPPPPHSPPHSSFPPWLEGMSIKEVTDECIPSTPDRQVGRVLKDPPPSNTLQPTPIEQFQLQRGGRCCSGAKRYCFGHFSGLKNDWAWWVERETAVGVGWAGPLGAMVNSAGRGTSSWVMAWGS